jgi:hypothetical protein
MIIPPAPGKNVTEGSWLNVELYDKRDQGFIEAGLTGGMSGLLMKKQQMFHNIVMLKTG